MMRPITNGTELVAAIEKRGAAEGFGNKGLGLHWLARHGFSIPETLVLTYAGSRLAGNRLGGEDPRLAQILAERIDPKKTYAVRSSANLEDGEQHSFAGQFTTMTDVRGLDAIREAIRAVLDSSRTAALGPYLRKLGEGEQGLEMAVLIQEMVHPLLAGVAFSKNPTTGLDEVVIEAVEGLGESLMQSGVTPMRWIFRWGQFTTRPEGREEWERVAGRIARETRRIARLYGAPVDLEWAYDGRRIFWLQIRPITRLARVPLYSNRISREVLPGIIKPLIASINIPLVNSAWIRLFESLLGPTGLQPEDLTRLFHHRAYFNMGAVGTIFEQLGFPRESLEMLLGLPVRSERPSPSWRTLRHLPRLLRFAAQAWNYDRRVAAELQAFEAAVRANQEETLVGLSEADLLRRIRDLLMLNTRIAYQNIVIPLLMNLYNALLRSQLGRAGVDILDVDITAGLDEIGQYDPNAHLGDLQEVLARYPQELQEQFQEMDMDQIFRDPRFVDICDALERFMRMFGHLSDSGNDFSRKPWREDLQAVLRMARDHVPGDRGRHQAKWETLPISRISRWRIRPLYRRARRFRFRREQVSSIYTASYGRFRALFNTLAGLLVVRGALGSEDEIYFLTWTEIQSLAGTPEPSAEFRERIRARMLKIDASREAQLPGTIYGNTPPPLVRVRNDDPRRAGVPTAPGYYQGPLTVVRSREDFERVQKGDVIAIPYSDVAWTPLFARAGAVVAEAGGMLSHSSIVAREYGIPCVVSVSDACSLPENSLVYVDGYQGEVRIVSPNGGDPGREGA